MINYYLEMTCGHRDYLSLHYMTNLVGLLGITHGRGGRDTDPGVEQLPEQPTER